MSKRWDWTHTLSKFSTWLALLSASSTASLGAYALMPGRVQDLFPEAAAVTLGILAVGSAFLIPVATAFRQKGIPTGVEIVSTVAVKGDVEAKDAARIAEAIATPTEVVNAGEANRPSENS